MAEKTIKVVIDGQEMVSPAAKKAEGAVESFTSKVKNLLAPLAALGIGAALGGFFKKAIEESLEGEQSMQRMQTAVENAGTSFAQMRPKIDSTIGDLTRLTVYTDDQLMSAFSDMTIQTGDARGSLANLGLAADLAAAKSIPLEAASSAIGKAFAGNTTALGKLIPELKGSTDIIGDLRIKVEGTAEQMGGTFAGSIERAKNQFSEFAQAVGDAIIGADSMQGSGNRLVDLLVQMTQWVEANRTEIGTLASGLLDLGEFLVRVSVILVETFGAGLSIIKRAIWGLAADTAISVGEMLKSFGTLVEKGGKFLKIFGIDVVQSAGQKMKDAGQEMVDVNKNKLLNVEADWYQAQVRINGIADRWSGTTVTAVKKVGESLDSHGVTLKRSTALTEDEIKKQDAAWKQYLKDYEAGIKRLDAAYDAYLKLLPKLQPALQEAMQTQHIEGQNRALAASKVAADAAFKAIKDGAEPLPALIKKSETSVGDMGTKLGQAADAVLVVGENFGGLDDDTKKVLESVKAIGVSMAGLAEKGLSFAGVAGMVGAIASIVSTMMSNDAERRQLTRENNTNLKRLTQEIGGLKLDITGDQFTAALAAFGPVADKLSRGELLSTIEFSQLQERFTAAGLSPAALVKMAKELGVGTVGSGASERVTDMGNFFRALGVTKIGKVGTNFADQLAFFRESQDLNGETGPDKFQKLVEFLITKGGVGALAGVDFSDPAKAKSSLLSLFSSLNEGGVSASLLGKISGGTLKDIISEIIRGLGEGAPSGSSAPAPGGTAVGGGSSSIVTGGATVPVKTLSDVLDGVVAQTTALAAYHVKHLSIATDHLAEARSQTVILTEIASNTRSLIDGGLEDMIDEKLSAKQSLAALSGGVGPSF